MLKMLKVVFEKMLKTGEMLKMLKMLKLQGKFGGGGEMETPPPQNFPCNFNIFNIFNISREDVKVLSFKTLTSLTFPLF